jgi:hypothetical protein
MTTSRRSEERSSKAMARRVDPDAVWLARRREVEGILARLEERIRRDREREERRRTRLRRLTFGLLGRSS